MVPSTPQKPAALSSTVTVVIVPPEVELELLEDEEDDVELEDELPVDPEVLDEELELLELLEELLELELEVVPPEAVQPRIVALESSPLP